jgi:hypothetical protein
MNHSALDIQVHVQGKKPDIGPHIHNDRLSENAFETCQRIFVAQKDIARQKGFSGGNRKPQNVFPVPAGHLCELRQHVRLLHCTSVINS